MPLHPDLEAFLEMAMTADRQPMHEMPPAEARRLYDEATEILDIPGPSASVLDLSIQCRDGYAMAARIYRPQRNTTGLQPAFLFLHGGGYVLGSLDSHDALCRSLAVASDCAVLAVDYRRAPEHKFPTAFLDAEDAAGWLRQMGGAYGLDKDRIAFGGDSVGGSLAAALCIADRIAKRPQPAAQILLYPCTAVLQDSASHRRFGEGYLLEQTTLQWMFAQYLHSSENRTDWRFAPLAAEDLGCLAPAHIFLAEYDPLVDEGIAYAERLRAQGGFASYRIYNGMIHDFARLGNITPEAATLHSDVAAVLKLLYSTGGVNPPQIQAARVPA